MLYKNIILLTFVLLIWGFQSPDPGFTEMKEVAVFRKGIEQMAASTNTIQAAFKQEKYMSILADKIDSEGIILFKKPNLLRWEYQKPFKYGIILNGKKIIIQDQGKVNSFDIASSQAFQQMNELIINSVQGNVLDEERFSIEYLQGDELYLAKLTPKDTQMSQFLERVDVYFSKKDFTVSKIKLAEPGGDYTLISFSNKKINEPIADERFAVK